jgi:flagellar motor switch protein FliN/FliY
MATEGTRTTPRTEDAAAAGSGSVPTADEKASEEQEDRVSMAGQSVPKEAVEAKTAQFSNVQDTGKSSGQRGLEFIMDIPLQVSVELGRTRLLVNDLLRLGQGSVIELSKLAGEPMEVLVNQKLVARGEVVVVNEKFGVRLTDIISPLERVEQLK